MKNFKHKLKIIAAFLVGAGLMVSASVYAAALFPSQGGTGLSTGPTKGDLLVGSSTASYAKLGVGANGLVLVASSTAPYGVVWQSIPAGGGGSVSTSSPITTNTFPFWASVTGGLSGTSTLTVSGSTLTQGGPMVVSSTLTTNGITNTGHVTSTGMTLTGVTSSIHFATSTGQVIPLNIGSGLSLSNGTLSATGGSGSGTVSQATTSYVAYYTASTTVSGTSTFTFNAASGTLALTGPAGTSTLSLGTSTKPACGIFRDSDDGGFTYMTWKDGIMYTSTATCQ